MLTASDFHQSRFQTKMLTEWSTSKAAKLVQLFAAVYLALVLSPTLADRLGIPRKTVANAFEVVCGWSVAGAVLYDIIITARRRRSVCQRLVINLPQLDQLTWCTSRHLTWRLRDDTEGMLIISVSELLKIAVWIIENEKKQFLFSQKIISELLERLNYWSQYGSHYFQFSTFYCLLRLSFGDY